MTIFSDKKFDEDKACKKIGEKKSLK